MFCRVLLSVVLLVALISPVSGETPQLTNSIATPLTPAADCPAPAHANEADHDAGYFVDSAMTIVQGFRPVSAMQVQRVSIRIANQLPVGDTITVELRTGGPMPGSQVLATQTINDPEVTYHWADFVFDQPPAVTPDAVYYLLAKGSGDSLSGFGWGVDASQPAYADSETWTSPGAGSWAARPDVDTMFRVWGTECGAVKVAIIAEDAEREFAEFVNADFVILEPESLVDAMAQLDAIIARGHKIHTLVFFAHAGVALETAVSPPRPHGHMQLGERFFGASDFTQLLDTFPNLAKSFVTGAQVQLLNCELGKDTAVIKAVARAFLRQGGGTVWAKSGNVGSFGTPTFWGLLDRHYFSADVPENPDSYFWAKLLSSSDGEWRAWYLTSEAQGNTFTDF